MENRTPPQRQIKENTQEFPPKTVLEKELEMEMQSLLKDKNFKGPKLNITLYFGEHATPNNAVLLSEFCKKEKIDLLADEYVYTGDLKEIIDPDTGAELVKKKDKIAQEMLEYAKTLEEELTVPNFRHDIAPGDFLRKEIVQELIQTTDTENNLFNEITNYSFHEFCKKMIDDTDKFRNLQRTREGVVLQTFAEKTAKGIVENQLEKQKEIKTLIFWGFNHYQFYKNLTHIHPNFKIHFQDPYLNNWIKENPNKTPPFALGMQAYNSIKNEEDQLEKHDEYLKDPYRYVAQELRIRLNSQEFHNWKTPLFEKGFVGEVYENVISEIDEMAKKQPINEKESPYYRIAIELFDQYQTIVRG